MRAFFVTFGASLGLLLAAAAAFNIAVDPLRYYRLQTWRKPVFHKSMQRAQNVGLARNLSYDTVVIGSSMMDNVRPSLLGRSWGVKAVKLSIAGSTAREQALILREALETGQVRRVLWSIDAFSFFSPADKVRDEQSFPFHMYRPPLLNIEYPLSLSTLRLSAMTLRGYGETDLDHLDVWDDQFEFNEAAALSAWHGNCASFKQKYDPGGAFPETLLRQLQDSVERNLAIVIRESPSVSFDLVLPPISTLSYYEPGSSLFTYVPFREALGKLLRYPNVRLHDLQIASEITNDLSNYKDLLHFNRAATVGSWWRTKTRYAATQTASRSRSTISTCAEMACRRRWPAADESLGAELMTRCSCAGIRRGLSISLRSPLAFRYLPALSGADMVLWKGRGPRAGTPRCAPGSFRPRRSWGARRRRSRAAPGYPAGRAASRTCGSGPGNPGLPSTCSAG
jgi:hypothetical protein